VEQLLLIAGFGIIALIAISQCAHHSAHRRERLDYGAFTNTERAKKWNHAVVTVDAATEPTRGEGTDREPCPK
jgi:hypothetical protein